MNISLRLQVVSIFVLALLAFAPLLIHAQTSVSTDISTSIRAEILKDPHASILTPAQIDTMVAALTSQAQARGVTPQDFTYHPGVPDPSAIPVPPTDPCADVSSALCNLGKVYGINSDDIGISLGLWLTSGLLALVIWKVRKNPHLNPQSIPTSVGNMPTQNPVL
jgi:hypothetical protein